VVYWKRDYNYSYAQELSDEVEYIGLDATNRRDVLGRMIETKRLANKTYEILCEKLPNLVYVSGIECMIAAQRYRQSHPSEIVLEIADLPGTSYLGGPKPIRSIIENKIDRLVLYADRLVFTSPFFYLDYYKERLDVSDRDVFVFENVPKKSVFSNYKKKPSKEFVIGFVGGVRYYDSLIALFRACSSCSHTKVMIAGKGPDYERILLRASEYSNVLVTGSYDYSRDVANIYSVIDLVYSVYTAKKLNERLAIPNKLYESIVCGIPILVAKNTRLAEYVEDLGVGFSVEDNNMFELRAIIERLISKPHLMDSARKRMEQLKERFFYESVESDFVKWLTGKKSYWLSD